MAAIDTVGTVLGVSEQNNMSDERIQINNSFMDI